MNNETLQSKLEPNMTAQWATLKELAEMKASRASEPDSEILDSHESERARDQALGRKLFRVIDRMEDRPDPEQKSATVERIHRLASNLGIETDLQDTIDRHNESIDTVHIGEELFANNPDLSAEEQAIFEKIQNRVVDLTEVEPGALKDRFPSRTFLFHGSTVDRLEKILQSGGLKNGVALSEDDPNINSLDLNSGFEGISWSMNAIDALPGTRGHIAGFLAAPEDILADDEQLVIPSRPALYEVLQASSEMNAKEFYGLKKQYETWGSGALVVGEMNNVHSNLMNMLSYDKENEFSNASKVYNYDGDLSAEALREHFTVDENDDVIWSEDLFQKAEVPPALPWMQSVIDRGYFEGSPYENLDTVEKLRDYTLGHRELVEQMLGNMMAESAPVREAYEHAEAQARAIRVKPENTYFVTSHRDADDWMRVMARSGVIPKGVLLYDDNKVQVENFASRYEGDHGELSNEIARAIDVDNDFWKREMQFDPREISRSGHVGQVLLDSAISHDRSIRLVSGQLEVV